MERTREHPTNEPTTLEGVQKVKSYTPMQSYFLVRLERLVHKQRELERHPSPDERALRLLKRAIYAVFRDCVDQGVGTEAQLILQQERPGS